MLERAELLAFAGDDQKGRADLVGMAFPGDGFAEAVKLVLVGDARHIHKAFLEGGRRLLENRVAARLVAHRHSGEGADARLMRGENGAEEGAEARARAADALDVDLRPRAQPVDQRLADRAPALDRKIDPDHGRLVLARSVD